jgi:hypothetical protein
MSDYLPIFAPKVYENPISPRFQWNHNGGYCGETSFIAAGLYYGQYLSQYDVRAIASPGMAQNALKNGTYSSQLLLGKNDASAANSLRLKHEIWPGDKSTEDFMLWVKKHVLQGHPVIIGVFNNITLLNEENVLGNGDSEYDHIVPVLGFGTDNKKEFSNKDVILLSDNGLYTPGNSIPFYHQFRMKPDDKIVGAYPFLGHRKAANNFNGNIYSVLKLKSGLQKNKQNYAIAITGVKDQSNETLPVRITTNLNYELPAIASDSNKRPKAMDLDLRITVSGLTPNTKYNLYEYNDENNVPIAKFNKHAGKASKKHKIKVTKGDTFTMTMPIKSKQKVFFRAVATDAK